MLCFRDFILAKNFLFYFKLLIQILDIKILIMLSMIITKQWFLNTLLLHFILNGLVFRDRVFGFIFDTVMRRTLNQLFDLVLLQDYAFFFSHLLLWKFDRLASAIYVRCWIGGVFRFFWWYLFPSCLTLTLVLILVWRYSILLELFLSVFVCLIFLAAVHKF